jgi:hypothetical protein
VPVPAAVLRGGLHVGGCLLSAAQVRDLLAASAPDDDSVFRLGQLLVQALLEQIDGGSTTAEANLAIDAANVLVTEHGGPIAASGGWSTSVAYAGRRYTAGELVAALGRAVTRPPSPRRPGTVPLR